jgi:hypothetical protein
MVSTSFGQISLACNGFALFACAVFRRDGGRGSSTLAREVTRERAHGRILQQRDDRQILAELVP